MVSHPLLQKIINEVLVGYYQNFRSNFQPWWCLTDLLKAKVKFEWSSSCQNAFENSIWLLHTAPVLATSVGSTISVVCRCNPGCCSAVAEK